MHLNHQIANLKNGVSILFSLCCCVIKRPFLMHSRCPTVNMHLNCQTIIFFWKKRKTYVQLQRKLNRAFEKNICKLDHLNIISILALLQMTVISTGFTGLIFIMVLQFSKNCPRSLDANGCRKMQNSKLKIINRTFFLISTKRKSLWCILCCVPVLKWWAIPINYILNELKTEGETISFECYMVNRKIEKKFM